MKYRICAVIVLFLTLLLCGSVFPQEIVTLDAPVGAVTGAASYRPGDVHFSLIRKTVEIVFYEWDGSSFVHPDDGGAMPINCNWSEIDGSVAMTQALNKADLSNNSLLKRIMTQAQTKGCLNTGTISGTPE